MKALTLVLISSLAFASASAALLARQGRSPQTIIRTPLLDAQLASDKSVHHVQIVSIDLEPAQKTGTHVHPIPVVGYVVKGRIAFQVEGQEPQTLAGGDAFFEPADARIIRFDNASDREPASFVANYLLGPADRELIKILPGNP